MLDPPAVIQQVQQERMECNECGAAADATVHATCNCKAGFRSAMQVATEYARQNPTASVRVIAEQACVAVGTAYKAKARVQSTEHLNSPTTVTGRDGKSYAASRPEVTRTPPPGLQPETRAPSPVGKAQAVEHLNGIVDYLRQVDQRERLDFRRLALQQMADAHLDETVF